MRLVRRELRLVVELAVDDSVDIVAQLIVLSVARTLRAGVHEESQSESRGPRLFAGCGPYLGR